MLHDATQRARPVVNGNKGRTVMARVREIRPPGHPCFRSFWSMTMIWTCCRENERSVGFEPDEDVPGERLEIVKRFEGLEKLQGIKFVR